MTDQPINLAELRANPWIVTESVAGHRDDAEGILLALIDAVEAAHAFIDSLALGAYVPVDDTAIHVRTRNELIAALTKFTGTQP